MHSCLAYTLAGDYQKAAQIGRKVIAENPNDLPAYRPLIASLGHLDELDEARALLARLLEKQPDFTIDWLRSNYPPLAADQFDKYAQGLRRAGARIN
jgi:adenylate cyclase